MLDFGTVTCPHCHGVRSTGNRGLPCERCKGAGDVLACTTCNGTGETSFVLVLDSRRERKVEPCERCDGTGAEPKEDPRDWR